MRMVRALAPIAATAGALVAAAGGAFAQSGEVNVYSYRESKLVQPLFDAFTKETGIKVNVISASAGLEQRIKTEGANSPADVLLTVDIGRLEDAVQAGITQPIRSDLLDKAVPPQLRDPEGHWYGVSMRARVVYASKSRVHQGAITYEELADPILQRTPPPRRKRPGSRGVIGGRRSELYRARRPRARPCAPRSRPRSPRRSR